MAKQQRPVLRGHEANQPAHRGGPRGRVEAHDGRGARGRRGQTRDYAKQRRLPGPVWAEDRPKLTGLDLERHVVERDHRLLRRCAKDEPHAPRERLVDLVQMVYCDDWFGHGGMNDSPRNPQQDYACCGEINLDIQEYQSAMCRRAASRRTSPFPQKRSSMSDSARMYGVLVTFDRPVILADTLDRLTAQTRQLDGLIVVDNGADGSAESVTKVHAPPVSDLRYVRTKANIGPAGGFALGMREFLDVAEDDDWIFLLDDDDPPFFDDAIERASRFAVEQAERDARTAGVGISGGRFDPRRGRVVRIGDDEISGAVPIDHVTGGGLPAYRVGPLRQVGVMRSELFFGFEELDMGLRLTRAGFCVYADGEAWKERKEVKRQAGLLPPEEVSARRADSIGWRTSTPSWRRYYSLRNLIQILRESGHGLSAARVSIARGLLKPAINLLISPRSASSNLRLGWLAVRDGWAGRTGRTLEPRAVPGHE